MDDNKDTNDVINDISLLYELSLSIGQSLDIKLNCAGFLKALMARKNLAFASVWIKNRYLPEVDSNHGASLVYAHPGSRIREKVIPLNHPLFRSLPRRQFASLTSSDPGYKKIVTEKGIRQGTFAIFALNGLGVVKLFSSTRKERFGKKELSQLSKVISKFSVSLEGCLAYQKSRREIAEREEAEETLRIERDFNKSLLQASPAFFAAISAAGLTLMMNKMMLKTLGYTEAEVVGTNYLATFVPEYEKEEVARIFGNLAEKHKTTLNRNHVLTKDGRELLVEWHGIPMFKDNGEFDFFFGVGIDITKHEQAIEDLRISRGKLRAMLASLTDHVSMIDRNMNIIWANDTARNMFGDDLLGKKCYRVYHNRETPCEPSPCIAQMAFEDSRSHTHEAEVIDKNGQTLYFESTANVALKDKDGNPTGVMEISRDITERKLAAETLRKERDFSNRLLQAYPTFFVALSAEGQTLMMNKMMLQTLGYTEDEVIGTNYLETFVPGEDRERVAALFEEQINIIEPTRGQNLVLTRDGRGLLVEWHNMPVFKKNGEFDFFFSIGIDITERSQMEKELLKASKLESLGIMAGGIAHDFNNILTGILGNISLARLEAKIEGGANDRLRDAEKAAMRAKALTQQLLTFSRGGIPIKETILITDFLREVIDFVLSGSNVACQLAMPDNLWPVAADVGQISQVIDNLIINAAQAMPEGGTIMVEAENVTVGAPAHIPLKQGEYVKLSVSDHGIGIQEEHLTKVFDPFFTTKQKGSGLGLTSSYSIVKNHDGLITVQSRLHQGTTFSIYLPRAPGQVRKKGKGRKREYIPGTGRILIIDDEEVVRGVAGRFVNHIGYQSDLADGGKKGIAMYEIALKKGSPYDAVLLDLTMPGGMGGKETARKIRALDRGAKIIASSGYSTDPIMSNFKKYGFDGALAKPYRITELSEVLERVIGKNVMP